MMRARLETDVHRGSACIARLAQRLDLGMRLAGALVPPFGHDLPIANDDRTDHRIRAGPAPALRGETKGQRHEPVVACRLCHRLERLLRVVAEVRVPARLVFFEVGGVGFAPSASAMAACAAARRAIATR